MRSIIIGTLFAALAGCANFEEDDGTAGIGIEIPDYDGDGVKGDELELFGSGDYLYSRSLYLSSGSADDQYLNGRGLGTDNDWCSTQIGVDAFDANDSTWPEGLEGYVRSFIPHYATDGVGGCYNFHRIDTFSSTGSPLCDAGQDSLAYWGDFDSLYGVNRFIAENPNGGRRKCIAITRDQDGNVAPASDNAAIMDDNPATPNGGDTDTNGSTERKCCVDADGDGYGTSNDCILVDVSDSCPSGRVANDNDLCDVVGGCGTGGGGGSGGDSSGYGQCAAGESAVRATYTAPANIVSFQLDERNGTGVSGQAKQGTSLLFGKIVPGGQSGTITGPSDPTTVVGSVSGNTATLTMNLCLTDDFTVFASGEYSGGKFLCEGSGTRNGTLTMDVDGNTVTPVVWQNPSGGCELMYHVTGNEVGGGGSGALYCDNDGDGYKSKWSSTNCTGSSSTTAGTDCGDNDGNVYPGATERLNGIDDDCDGTADEGLSASTDVDHDGYTVVGGDCNDNSASVHPGASEVVGDSIDQDCNGHDSCFVNNDQDLFGTSSTIDAVGLTCAQLQGRATVSGDCNDNNPSIYPGAIEVSNGLDDNCDGTIDNVGSGGGTTRTVTITIDNLAPTEVRELWLYNETTGAGYWPGLTSGTSPCTASASALTMTCTITANSGNVIRLNGKVRLGTSLADSWLVYGVSGGAGSWIVSTSINGSWVGNSNVLSGGSYNKVLTVP